MAGTRRRSAGIHIDGQVATLVLLERPDTTPKVTAVRTAQGFTATEAIQRLLPLVEPDRPLRVTFATDGITTLPVDLTPAMLDRAGFTTAARRTLGTLHSGAVIAGIVADPDAVTAGMVATGLAIAAPSDIVTSLYRTLATHAHAEVTVPAAAHGALDGLHLTLRRATSELTLVTGGVPLASRILTAGGSDVLAVRLGSEEKAAAAALADPSHDPAAASVIRSWLSAVVDEATATCQDWSLSGLPTGTDLWVAGKSAGAAQLDELLHTAGLTRNPHPLVGLPTPAPLDAVDAYLAAVSAGTRMPLAAFHNPLTGTKPPSKLTRRRTPHPSPGQPTKQRRLTTASRTRTRLVRTLAAATVLTTVGAVAASSWSAFTASADHATAREVAAADPAAARAVAAGQLRHLADTHAATTQSVAAIAALCTPCAVTVTDTAPESVTVRVSGTDVDPLLTRLADHPDLTLLTQRRGDDTVTLTVATTGATAAAAEETR